MSADAAQRYQEYSPKDPQTWIPKQPKVAHTQSEAVRLRSAKSMHWRNPARRKIPAYGNVVYTDSDHNLVPTDSSDSVDVSNKGVNADSKQFVRDERQKQRMEKHRNFRKSKNYKVVDADEYYMNAIPEINVDKYILGTQNPSSVQVHGDWEGPRNTIDSNEKPPLKGQRTFSMDRTSITEDQFRSSKNESTCTPGWGENIDGQKSGLGAPSNSPTSPVNYFWSDRSYPPYATMIHRHHHCIPPPCCFHRTIAPPSCINTTPRCNPYLDHGFYENHGHCRPYFCGGIRSRSSSPADTTHYNTNDGHSADEGQLSGEEERERADVEASGDEGSERQKGDPNSKEVHWEESEKGQTRQRTISTPRFCECSPVRRVLRDCSCNTSMEFKPNTGTPAIGGAPNENDIRKPEPKFKFDSYAPTRHGPPPPPESHKPPTLRFSPTVEYRCPSTPDDSRESLPQEEDMRHATMPHTSSAPQGRQTVTLPQSSVSTDILSSVSGDASESEGSQVSHRSQMVLGGENNKMIVELRICSCNQPCNCHSQSAPQPNAGIQMPQSNNIQQGGHVQDMQRQQESKTERFTLNRSGSPCPTKANNKAFEAAVHDYLRKNNCPCVGPTGWISPKKTCTGVGCREPPFFGYKRIVRPKPKWKKTTLA